MKTTLIILFGRIVQVLISFVSLKIITNYLSKENVAYYFLFLSVMNYFGLALISPVGQYFNRRIHSWSASDILLPRLVLQMLYSAIVAIISIPILVYFKETFEIMKDINSSDLSLVMCLTIFFNTIVTTIVPTFNMLNHRLSFVFFTTLWQSLSLILSVFLIKSYGENILTWFKGQIIVQSLVSLISLFVLKKISKQKFKIKTVFYGVNYVTLRRFFSFCVPLLLSTFLMWIATDSFRFILEVKYSLEYVGLLSVGFAIAQRFSYAIETIVQQLLFPVFYKKINNINVNVRNEAWLGMFYLSVPIYLVVTLITVLFSNVLLTIFSSPDYINAGEFVVAGALFHFFRKITALFAMLAHSELTTYKLVAPYLVGAFVSSFVLYYNKVDSGVSPSTIIILAGALMMLMMIYKTKDLITFKMNKQIVKNIIKNIL